MRAIAHTRPHRGPRRGLGTLAVWLILTLTLPQPVQTSPTTYAAHLEGQALDAQTGRPIAGAQATLGDLGLSTTTGADGRFTWRDIPLSDAAQPVTVTVAAPGYAGWSIQHVALRANDTLILTAHLSGTPTHIAMPTAPLPRPTVPDLAAALPAATDDHQGLPLPGTIRVRVTNYPYCDTSRPYTVQVIGFRTYLQHVLPNEWPAGWHPESLRAGAMAAKTYAWYWVARGGKWPDADVYDSTCDQYYNPAVAYASTNAAIDATWNWRLTRHGLLIHTSYREHHWMCASAGIVGSCMGIVDSHDMAKQGYPWQAILSTFYVDTALSPIVVMERRYLPMAFAQGREWGVGSRGEKRE